ncbi:MAG: c-type cytochrome [Candidatus Acidiferrum sp.]
MNSRRHHRRPLPAAAMMGWALLTVLGAGCSTSPGRPAADSATLAPSEILDFPTLFADNCSGCHGAEGRGGAAIALSDPVYLAIVDDATIRKTITSGVRGTAMAAFAQSAGGMLTAKQVEVLTSGIRASWTRPGILASLSPPSYAPRAPGDVAHGALVFKTYCQSCHGPDGRGGGQASSITDDSFLALTSDQGLRTVVITGRPELGAPDWRGNLAGKPMSEQEITDVVAWLVAQRVQTPGQPYSVANRAQH